MGHGASVWLRLFGLQQRVDFGHHREGVGDIDHVGLAAGPAAVGVQRDGAPVADEPPAHHVRLLAVAAGGEALGWRGVEPVCPIWFMWVRKGSTGSPSPPWSTSDLLLPSDAPASAQEAENQLASFGDMHLAVGLLFGPSGAGDKEHLGVGTDGLRVPAPGRGEPLTVVRSAGKLDHNLLNLMLWLALTRKGCVGSRIQQQEPGAHIAADDRLDPLAIEPARASTVPVPPRP